MYGFQSESTLYSWLNVKELIAPNRHDIRSLTESNFTRTQSHLAGKQTLKHLDKLAKSLSFALTTYL